jgi:histidine triad (HIT) family protein
VSDDCLFCGIVRGTQHAGHTLVIPRQHLRDVRELDGATGAALMASVARLARAVTVTFPNRGLSVWHSIGEAADQEVPHLHFHVHPRMPGDGLLRVYPSAPALPGKPQRDDQAAALRCCLERLGSRDPIS